MIIEIAREKRVPLTLTLNADEMVCSLIECGNPIRKYEGEKFKRIK